MRQRTKALYGKISDRYKAGYRKEDITVDMEVSMRTVERALAWVKDQGQCLDAPRPTVEEYARTDFPPGSPVTKLDCQRPSRDLLEGVPKLQPLQFPDYEVPEDVDWREWFENFSNQQDMHKRIDPRQSIVTIQIPDVKRISVVSTSDLHLGGGFTNHRALRTTMEFILNTPNQYLWIAGDSIEGFIPGVKPAETLEQQTSSLRAQIAAWRSLVEELCRLNKLLFVTWGDHDGKWFEQSIGFNVMKPMIDRQVPYINQRGLIKLIVGEQMYYVLVNHGERFSSQYSHTHPQRRAYDQFFPADVIVGGHKHHPEWRVMWHYMQLQDAGLPVGGKTILVANGTFKTGPDSYSCRYWEHGIMGVPTLTFSGESKDLDIFENPVKAAQFLEGAANWKEDNDARSETCVLPKYAVQEDAPGGGGETAGAVQRSL